MIDRAAAEESAREAIERCAELTGSMLRAAIAGDWQRVAELESQRSGSCVGIRLDGVDMDELDAVRERLRILVAMDAGLSKVVVEGRGRSLDVLRTVRGAAKASAAYQALSGRV